MFVTTPQFVEPVHGKATPVMVSIGSTYRVKHRPGKLYTAVGYVVDARWDKSNQWLLRGLLLQDQSSASIEAFGLLQLEMNENEGGRIAIFSGEWQSVGRTPEGYDMILSSDGYPLTLQYNDATADMLSRLTGNAQYIM